MSTDNLIKLDQLHVDYAMQLAEMREEHCFDYRDGDGKQIYQAVKTVAKVRLRRPDGNGGWTNTMRGVEPLPYRLPELLKAADDAPVFIAETEPDCDALAKLGLVASCNDGGRGKWNAKISPHFAGLDVAILAGSGDAGRAHAEMVARRLHGTARSVRIVAMPGLAQGIAIRHWFERGRTGDDLRRLADEAPDWAPPDAAEDLILDPHAPLATARRFAEHCRERRLLHHAGQFYQWIGPHYQQHDDLDVATLLYGFLEGAKREGARGDIEPFNPEKSDIDKVHHALRSVVLVSSRLTPPTWLEPGADDSPLIACANGLLRLSDGKLLPHNPGYFNVASLDFPYQPAAPQPAEFLKFLDSLWAHDRASIDTLQELFGYIISGENDHQKMFLLVGPPRAGKGTIGHLLQALSGRSGYLGLPLASFRGDFGLSPLVNKTLAIVPDARLGAAPAEIIERLLAISGGDDLTIHRKFKEAVTVRLAVRFVFLTNEVPKFRDNSGAIASRFVVLQFVKNFLGREDKTLAAKLRAEMPSILNWAIEGWRRLNSRGYFEQPASADEAVNILGVNASPIKAFIEDECERGAEFTIKKKQLFGAWLAWCDAAGIEHPGNESGFGRDLHAAHPTIGESRPRDGVDRDRCWVGIGLRARQQQTSSNSAPSIADDLRDSLGAVQADRSRSGSRRSDQQRAGYVDDWAYDGAAAATGAVERQPGEDDE